ncbi:MULTISPECIES: amidase [Roseomonadaceae]|uniref:Amidase n=1 Tax=Falsiroseomonas oleicola TaxID=2801474 RepID=A0ABS6HAG8_9PROT|nr:amidase [Roseomonas oleicola]MBU8545346.1 amidase [Roseomonas oleicola]
MTLTLFPRDTAAGMAARLADGTVTPEALLRTCLDRIAALDGTLHAWVHLDPEGAARAAAASGTRHRAGVALGPLDGVPVSVKDNLHVAGMPARWGSRFFADFVPAQDDIVVERLRAAGAMILGKTSTPEFALSGRCFSPLTGHTRNPLDPALTPGGSSGGAVAAVAAGMVPLAIATDAGGSTRLPAGYTGLVGLRPSNGRIARRHGFPAMALDFQAVGLIAATLADLRLLYAAVAGPDARDPTSQRQPPEPMAGPGRRPRIGCCAAIEGELVDPAVRQAVAESAARLAAQGCEVVPCTVPYDLAALRDIWGVLTAAGVARMAARFPARWEAEASDSLKPMARRGAAMPAAEYVEALDRLATFRADVSARWGAHDALLLPSAAAPAWPVEQEFPAIIDDQPGHARAQNVFATWVNAMGWPGLTVPGQPHPDGRPIGVQLVGSHGSEALLFDLAQRLVG